MNLTLVLEDVEVPPDQLFGMVVTESFSQVLWAPLGLPQLIGLLNMKRNQAALGIKPAGTYRPLGS